MLGHATTAPLVWIAADDLRGVRLVHDNVG
jgi:hypothetical protein